MLEKLNNIKRQYDLLRIKDHTIERNNGIKTRANVIITK